MTTTTARPRPFDLSTTTPSLERMPPYNAQAEVGVLSSMMQDQGIIGQVIEFIPKADYFFREEHQILFSTFVDFYNDNKAWDATILMLELKRRGVFEQIGGMDTLTAIARAEADSVYALHYAAYVAEDYQKRRLISTLTKSLRDVYDSTDNAQAIQDRVVSSVFELEQQKVAHQATMAEVLDATFVQIEAAKNGVGGIEFPFPELQNLTMGMHPGESIIVAGRPGSGKSAFAQALIMHACVDHFKPVPALVFSLEMSFEQWGLRMICARAGVESSKVRRGQVCGADLQAIKEAKEIICEAPIYFDNTPGLNPAQMRTKARRMVHDKGIKMVVIDYLQLMEAGKNTDVREQEVAYISRQCKQMAQDLNVPVIVLAQLNRENEKTKRRPQVSDLRESGSLEQDADVVILLHREWKLYDNDPEWQKTYELKKYVAEANLAKQRNGETGIVNLIFYGPTMRYMSPETAFHMNINYSFS